MFDKLIEEIGSRASEEIKPEQGDYIVDGLLYCGKCNTAKQIRKQFLGREITPYCLCECAAKKRDNEEQKFKRRQRQERVERNRKAGFANSDLVNCTFERDDRQNEKISDCGLNYVKNFETFRSDGKGLLFYGGVGTGKTFIAAAIANSLLDKGYTCLVTNFSQLVNTIQGMYTGRQEYIDSLNNYDLLIVDDLGVERDTEYVNEIVYTIVDNRYRAGLPIVVTTNLTGDELKYATDVQRERTLSRLMEMTVPVEVKGSDRRKEKLKKEYGECKKLLGL